MKGVVRPLGWAAPQPRRAVLARSSLPARVSPTTLREVVSDISITLYGRGGEGASQSASYLRLETGFWTGVGYVVA